MYIVACVVLLCEIASRYKCNKVYPMQLKRGVLLFNGNCVCVIDHAAIEHVIAMNQREWMTVTMEQRECLSQLLAQSCS